MTESEPPGIVRRVEAYLREAEGRYPTGTDEFFAARALAVALRSFRAGNYGIGAVAVVRDGTVSHEYEGGNAMVTGDGLVDHAETRALLRIARRELPEATYDLAFDEGSGSQIVVFGTLEPCPMCACVLTNAGASRSVSTILDGNLVQQGDYLVSDGAANVLEDKFPIQPQIWRMIQERRQLSFEMLNTEDEDLRTLSLRIFTETRAVIDKRLGTRPPIGQRDSVRALYSQRFQSPEATP